MGAACFPENGQMESTLVPRLCSQSPACSRQPGSHRFGIVDNSEDNERE